MKLAHLFLISSVVLFSSHLAFAFDQCETVMSSPNELIRQIGETAVARSPVKYHSVAQSIKLVTRVSGNTLIPFAADQQGTKVIVFPPLFASVVCKLALAQFLILEGAEPGAFDQAAANAAKCFDSGGSQKTCLVGFANEFSPISKPSWVSPLTHKGSPWAYIPRLSTRSQCTSTPITFLTTLLGSEPKR